MRCAHREEPEIHLAAAGAARQDGHEYRQRHAHCVGTSGVLLIYRCRQRGEEPGAARGTLQAQVASVQVDGFVRRASTTLLQMAQVASSSPRSSPALRSYLQNILPNLHRTEAFDVYFAFSGTSRKNHPRGLFFTRPLLPKAITSTYNFNQPKYPWYWIPKTQHRLYISDPYYGQGGKISMVSITRPVLRAGGGGEHSHLKGVVGIDIDLTALRSISRASVT